MWSFWLCYVRINKLPPRSRICPAAFEGGNAMPAHSNMTQGCFQRTWTEQSCYSGGWAVFPLATLKSLLIAGSDKWWGFWIGRCKRRSVSISGRRSVSISGRLSPLYLSLQGSPMHRLDNHSSFLTSVQDTEVRWGKTGFYQLPHGHGPRFYWGQRTGPLYLPQVNLNPFCLSSALACFCCNVHKSPSYRVMVSIHELIKKSSDSMDRTVQNHKNKRSPSFLPVDGNGVSVSRGQPRSSVQHDTFTQTREEQWTQQGKTGQGDDRTGESLRHQPGPYSSIHSALCGYFDCHMTSGPGLRFPDCRKS